MDVKMNKSIGCIALLAGYALLFQAFATATEIISRKLFNYSFQGIDEIGGYVLAITASFGFGYAALTRSHTRVDFILLLVPAKIRAAVHVISAILMALIAAGMLWYAIQAITETLEYQSIANSPLETPIWIPQSIWLIGFVVFAVVACYLAFRAVVLFACNDLQTLERELGTASAEEEVDALEDELAMLNHSQSIKG